MQQRLRKFQREPERVPDREITDRTLAIVATIARYRFIPTSLLIRLVPGNEDVTHRHLQFLYHRGYVSRFSFPHLGSPSEFCYYLDNPPALKLLVEHGASPDALPFEEVRRNREKAYGDIHDRVKADEALGRMLFLKHEAIISRFHAMLELGCGASGGKVELADWRQGSSLWNTLSVPKTVRERSTGRWVDDEMTETLPHRPDAFFTLRFPQEPEGGNRAHFFYEADRKRTTTKKFRRKLRAHFHFIVRQRKHEEKYGIRRVRAVLVETVDTAWAEELRQAARHPAVSGDRPTPLFWFTASAIFTQERDVANGTKVQKLPRFLVEPTLILKPVWVSPVDDKLHSLVEA